jgi:hypothetical protein
MHLSRIGKNTLQLRVSHVSGPMSLGAQHALALDMCGRLRVTLRDRALGLEEPRHPSPCGWQARAGRPARPVSVPDRAEHRLLVVPPDPAQLEVVVPAERAGSGRGDPTVHQDQLKPPGDPLLGVRVQVPLRDQRRNCDHTRVQVRMTRAGSATGSRCGRRTASRPPPTGGPVRAWVRACRAC